MMQMALKVLELHLVSFIALHSTGHGIDNPIPYKKYINGCPEAPLYKGLSSLMKRCATIISI